ncbi:MAG: hypothetical protein KJ968_01455 [Nanoarchaeota archaeon]|nr:hypothetical protein [Nanoarchaeota archaeon]
MLDFLKKKKEEEEKTDIKQEVQIPEPQESEKMLTELPEFPTMAEEDFSPLPKIESLSELEKSEIKIPLLGETAVKKPVIYPEKNMAPEFGELKKEVEEQEIELPKMLREEVEKTSSLPAKTEISERKIFNPKKPVFVNVKSYQGISDEINLVTAILEESEEIVNRLNSIKIRENNELKKLHDSLDGLNKKIIAVDNILSKG